MRAILLLSCPDTMGIVAEVSYFISSYKGNILNFDQHSHENNYFMRVEWDLSDFSIPAEKIGDAFEPIAQKFNMDFQVELALPADPNGDLCQCLRSLPLTISFSATRKEMPTPISAA